MSSQAQTRNSGDAGSSSTSSSASVKSFVVWNNKGGVGKSTLTFHIICEYAMQFPNKKFIVIDMCPQANCSAYFLGGGRPGYAKAGSLMNAEGRPCTVSGLLSNMADTGNYRPDRKECMKYVVNVAEKRGTSIVPNNIFLLCGDHALDLIAPYLEEVAGRRTVLTSHRDFFHDIHTSIRNFIEIIAEPDPENWVAFVDTNPAFTIYTRIALCSANELLVPFNPDEFSVSAVRVITMLLTGSFLEASPYNVSTFSSQAERHHLQLPKLRLVIANRFVVRQGYTPKLYQGVQQNLANAFLEVLKNPLNHDFLVPLTRDGYNLTGVTVDAESFAERYTAVVPLFQSAGIYSSVSGLPITAMRADKKVQVSGKESSISAPALTTAGWSVQDIIVHLEKAVTGFSQHELHTGKKTTRRIRPDSSYLKRKLLCEEGKKNESEEEEQEEFEEEQSDPISDETWELGGESEDTTGVLEFTEGSDDDFRTIDSSDHTDEDSQEDDFDDDDDDYRPPSKRRRISKRNQ